ncbi:MAG TPA: inositol monophosphatase family protein, partial [Gaiellaceae bacterium]
ASSELATRAAFRAGRLAMSKIGQPGYLKWRGRRDVIVGSAIEVQDVIVNVIREECPNDAILTEEGPEDEVVDVDAERLWIVDPICGSLNFAQGIPLFAVSIALRTSGVLRLGVVYDPMRDEMFSAQVGGPATLNNNPISARSTSFGPEFWDQAWVAADLPHDGPMLLEALRVFGLTAQEVQHQLVLGSPALGICYVAAGRLQAYWTLEARPWDVAAAGVIVQQAGGLITDGDGGSWIHSDGSYVAADAVTHQWSLKIIKTVRQQRRERAALER